MILAHGCDPFKTMLFLVKPGYKVGHQDTHGGYKYTIWGYADRVPTNSGATLCKYVSYET